MTKLPQPDDGTPLTLEDDVTLRYYRMQQTSDGSIDLGQGEGYPLKSPTDVGTAGVKDEAVPLSTFVGKLNERFGTDFTEADQYFFDQIRVSAERNEKINAAAKANTWPNFKSYLERVMDELFIERMGGNENFFSRMMSDQDFDPPRTSILPMKYFGMLEKTTTEQRVAQSSRALYHIS